MKLYSLGPYTNAFRKTNGPPDGQTNYYNGCQKLFIPESENVYKRMAITFSKLNKAGNKI